MISPMDIPVLQYEDLDSETISYILSKTDAVNIAEIPLDQVNEILFQIDFSMFVDRDAEALRYYNNMDPDGSD